jgi:hypothetical protein
MDLTISKALKTSMLISNHVARHYFITPCWLYYTMAMFKQKEIRQYYTAFDMIFKYESSCLKPPQIFLRPKWTNFGGNTFQTGFIYL